MNKYLYIVILLVGVQSAYAWDWWPLAIRETVAASDTIGYSLEANAVSGTGRVAPFWIQTGRNGQIAASPHSGALTIGIEKTNQTDERWWDYDFALSLTGQLHSRIQSPDGGYQNVGRAYTNNLYAHVRLYIVDVTVGIKPLNYNSGDAQLTSGSLLFSGNARAMPRVTIGIDRWTAFPGLYGYLEIRGGVSQMLQWDDAYVTRALVHHKYIGARIGGKLPVQLIYQFHHVAQWGGYSPVYGDLGNDLKAFANAFLARSGGTMRMDQNNAQGNHIGEQQLALEVNIDGWHATAYWHQMFEDGPIRFMTHAMNVRDGLWGVNIQQDKWPFISSITYELLHTTDQSGPFHDKDGFIYGGNDNYYQNGIYQNGWAYYFRTLGTPFITSPVYNEDGAIETKNNRVWAHYAGIRGDIYGYRYRVVCSHARNYGTYASALSSRNTAWMVEVSKHVEKAWGLDFGLTLAGDVGNQFGNSFGAMLTVGKKGILKGNKE